MAPINCPDCGEAGRVEVIPGRRATRLDPPEPPHVGRLEIACACYDADPDGYMRRVAANLF